MFHCQPIVINSLTILPDFRFCIFHVANRVHQLLEKALYNCHMLQ